MAQALYDIISNINKQIRAICCKIESLSPAPPAYKVYTALLTQSGGDSPKGYYEGGDPLIVGMTYMIENNGGNGWDFTNIGAPNNDIGTFFVATGTIPNSWGVDGYLVGNEGAPVVTVLENTIGNIWFERQEQGSYNCLSSGLFPEDKTFITISAQGRPLIFAFRFYSDNLIQIQTTNVELGNQEWNNEFPGNFEIRVYN